MHHKYRRPKQSRAGCHMCKPWKLKMNKAKNNSADGPHIQEQRARLNERDEVRDVGI